MTTRSELIEKLTSKFTQLQHRDVDLTVKIILDAMAQTLENGHRIEIRGFGSFVITRRLPRVGRNPKSGEQVIIPEKNAPHFKTGKQLRERVNYKK